MYTAKGTAAHTFTKTFKQESPTALLFIVRAALLFIFSEWYGAGYACSQ